MIECQQLFFHRVKQIWNEFYVISLQVLLRKKQNPGRLYQDSRPLFPSVSKGNSKIEILLLKIFSLK